MLPEDGQENDERYVKSPAAGYLLGLGAAQVGPTASSYIAKPPMGLERIYGASEVKKLVSGKSTLLVGLPRPRFHEVVRVRAGIVRSIHSMGCQAREQMNTI